MSSREAKRRQLEKVRERQRNRMHDRGGNSVFGPVDTEEKERALAELARVQAKNAEMGVPVRHTDEGIDAINKHLRAFRPKTDRHF
jgi:hypothetical protein